MLARRTAVVACLGVIGCNALLGIEPAVHDPAPGVDAGAGAPSEPSDGASDATVTVDAAAPDPEPPEAGACADTDKNPRHCGACNHDCGTGACVASVCQPGVVVTDAAGPRSLVVTSTHVLYLSVLGDLRRVPIFGGPPATLYSGAEGRNLVVIGSDVYFADFAGQRIARCPIVGTCTAETVIGQFPNPYLLATTNGELFAADGPDGTSIRRCSSPPCVETAVTFASNEGRITHLVASGDSVVWARADSDGSSAIRKKSILGGPATPLFLSGAARIDSLVVAGRNAYGVVDGDLFSFSLDTARKTPLTRTGTTSTLALDENDFWYGRVPELKIYRRPIRSPFTTPSVVVTDTTSAVRALAKHESGLYWAADDRVYRLVQ